MINALEEVQEACSLTGVSDYLVKMTVPNLKALARIFNDVVLPPESVADVRSAIVLDCLKRSTRLPLSYLAWAGAKRD